MARDKDLYEKLGVRRAVRNDEKRVIEVYPPEPFVPLGVETAPPLSDHCPRCHRPMNGFKWHWYYESTGQRALALIYRIINR